MMYMYMYKQCNSVVIDRQTLLSLTAICTCTCRYIQVQKTVHCLPMERVHVHVLTKVSLASCFAGGQHSLH